MKRWVIYCAGNADYVLSPNKEPIRMLNSFRAHFGNTVDYVYFTDKNESRLEEVKQVCEENNIKLVVGDCKRHHDGYRDIQYVDSDRPGRWPDAHYWYCEAPAYFKGTYDYAIKCDGDMLCINSFDLTELEVDNAVTITRAPDWYTPYDKFCPNAGMQILNIQTYVEQDVRQLFRDGSRMPHLFNGDTPLLDSIVRSNLLNVHVLSADYNYLLFDLAHVHQLTENDFSTVKIIHFVSSKPYNLDKTMIGSIKEKYAKLYLEY